MHASLIYALAGLILQSSPPARQVYTNVRQPMPQAYFVMQYTYLLKPTLFPAHYWPYTLIVCNQSIEQDDIESLLDPYLPGATLLAYEDAQNINVAGSRTGAHWDSLEARMTAAFGTDTTFCIRNLTTGDAVRMDGSDAHPSWIPYKESVDVLVAFNRDITLNDRWDGMYLDDCTAAYPSWRQALLQDILDASQEFDINGDNVADTIQDAVDQWATWRPYLTAQLREILGTKLLVCNAAGRLNDSCANGICIEGVGHTVAEDSAAVYFVEQQAVGRSPFVSVGWVTQASTDVLPCARMTQTVPGVYYGVVE